MEDTKEEAKSPGKDVGLLWDLHEGERIDIFSVGRRNTKYADITSGVLRVPVELGPWARGKRRRLHGERSGPGKPHALWTGNG